MAANLQLTGALEQRDLLIREVYHRVKNNLQTVDALMAMHARQLADASAKDALLSLRQRVHALGLVHQQLLQSSDLKTFDIAPFLHDLSHNIIQSGAERGVDVSVAAIPLKVGLDFAIPLGLLVTELLTNALKHAFPDGRGKIEVVLERNADAGLALIVNDDGKGLPEALPPPNAPKPGQGINIITGLVNQLRGTMTRQNDHGTRTEIHMAIPGTP
jgi:two-component sensor histidine kinase